MPRCQLDGALQWRLQGKIPLPGHSWDGDFRKCVGKILDSSVFVPEVAVLAGPSSLPLPLSFPVHNLPRRICQLSLRGDCWCLSFQLLRCVWPFATPWTAAPQAFLPITNSQSWLKLMSMALVMPSSHLILCRPLLFLTSIFPSIRVFSKESVLRIRWAKYWNFSFSVSPSNAYSGLISFRIDWFDLLAVQGTLKNPLQHYSSKAPCWLLKPLNFAFNSNFLGGHPCVCMNLYQPAIT